MRLAALGSSPSHAPFLGSFVFIAFAACSGPTQHEPDRDHLTYLNDPSASGSDATDDGDGQGAPLGPNPPTAGGGGAAQPMNVSPTEPPSQMGPSQAGAGSPGTGPDSEDMPAPSEGSGDPGVPGGAGDGPGNPPEEPVEPEIPTIPATCQGDFAAVALEGAQHAVSVDNTESWGELPHFWSTYGTGQFELFIRGDRDWGPTLQRHVLDGIENLGLTSVRQHGLFHDAVGIYKEENGTPVYDFTKADQIFDFFVDNGIEPIVELGSMPAALARDPSQVLFLYEQGVSPPKDFQLWQDLVYEFVAHYVERYGAEVVQEWLFEVWNEPECCSGKFWTGTLEEYFELYDHSVAGVTRALPNGRIGGPVASQPIELTQNSQLGILFLDHVTTDNYVNPGNPGQLDFFAFHSWSFIDGAVNGHFTALDLLDSYGFNDVRVAVTEFGPTWQFNLYDEPQEMTQGAAFVAQTYADISMRVARDGKRFPLAYSWWVLSDIFEEDPYREDEPFIGCMGLISREDIRKPAYNAFKFLAQMGNEQLPISVDTPGGVGGMATKDANGAVKLILYNGQNPGQGPADDRYYEVTGDHDIAVSISGLDPALPYDVTAYKVDETHGNAYGVWQGMGRPKMPDMTEEDWQALRDNMDSPAEPLGSAQCGGTFTQRFTLPSPGVLFVTLTPTPGTPVE